MFMHQFFRLFKNYFPYLKTMKAVLSPSQKSLFRSTRSQIVTSCDLQLILMNGVLTSGRMSV